MSIPRSPSHNPQHRTNLPEQLLWKKSDETTGREHHVERPGKSFLRSLRQTILHSEISLVRRSQIRFFAKVSQALSSHPAFKVRPLHLLIVLHTTLLDLVIQLHWVCSLTTSMMFVCPLSMSSAQARCSTQCLSSTQPLSSPQSLTW